MSDLEQNLEARSEGAVDVTPSALLSRHGDQVQKILRRFGMKNPRVFGSTARSEDTTQSDLDIVVDAPPGASLYDLSAAENELEQLLGIKVDLVTKGFLAADVALRVDLDAVPIR